jgi:hypothetical protein
MPVTNLLINLADALRVTFSGFQSILPGTVQPEPTRLC